MPRRKPFSGKAKREQLKEKRRKQRDKDRRHDLKLESDSEEELTALGRRPRAQGPDERTLLQKEKDAQVRMGKIASRAPIDRSNAARLEDEGALRYSVEDLDRIECLGREISIPLRGKWSKDMSKEELDLEEKEAFRYWLDGLEERFTGRLNVFEHNLEVWRQLWRTVEMSDVVCIVIDCRNPPILFPFSLFFYLESVQKPVVIVLNKADLVSPGFIREWETYFTRKFPGILVTSFASRPRKSELVFDEDEKPEMLSKRQLKMAAKSKRNKHARGTQEVLDACKQAVISRSTLELIHDCFDFTTMDEEDEKLAEKDSILDDEFTITIGMVGNPNAGKSSLINGLMDKSVVSVSRTPGHTKHFQTVFLNRKRDPETGNWSRGLRLCDCPGLVFPLVDVPKSIQVLSSLFPLAQLREPFTAIHFASERLAVPLQDIYGLKPYNSDDESDVKYTKMDSSEQSRTMKPREKKAEKHKKVLVCDLEASMETAEQREGCADSEEVSLAEHDSEDKCAVQASSESFEWNGWSVCEALATARGFLTARSGRADVYRAAISILKDIVDGRVLVAWLPPLEHVS